MIRRVLNNILTLNTYIVYSSDVQSFQEGIKLKAIKDIEIISIDSVEDLLNLKNQGYSFGNYEEDKSLLSKQLIGFFAFINKEYAHSTWITFNKDSKDLIDPLPFEVLFDKKESLSGKSLTPPRYRSRGVYTHTYTKIFKYLKSKGIKNDKFSIRKNNIVSRVTLEKFPVFIDSSIYKIKVFNKYDFYIPSRKIHPRLR